MINLNTAFEDELYFNYLKDPDSVSVEWRDYFDKIHGKTIVPMDSRNFPPVQNKKISNTEQIKFRSKPYEVKDGDFIEEMMPYQANIAMNMNDSIQIPSATSFRTIPVKVLDENKRIINRYFQRLKKDRISFTHILAWSIVKGLIKFPHLNDTITEIDDKSYRVRRPNINVGLAVDVVKNDGSRFLVIPSIKNVQNLTFAQFVNEFERLITLARFDKLELKDLEDATITLTNPGMIGTSKSVPRLMHGQSMIIASGSIDYPPEFQAVRPELLANFAVSKVVNLSNTYDHRIIQGAESAEFLAYINKLLLGSDQFYDQIFYSLQIPFEPLKWAKDKSQTKYGLFNPEEDIEKGAHVMQMINAYRVRGHLLASINPLGHASYYYPELDPAFYGFTIWDLDRIFHADDSWENNNLQLREILEILRETYCTSSGFEFMHIQNPERKEWIKSYLEKNRNDYNFSKDEKQRILTKLLEAETYENYLHTKFVGHKRFSLEGGESFMVILDKVMEYAADTNIDTVVIGMAHRGRLNVLAHSLGKSYEKMFKEFDGDIDPNSFQGSGDVKYHLGEEGVFQSSSNRTVKVKLSPNPSHLELVNPVVEGMARAIEASIKDESFTRALPVLVHGDAAFAGQGIVAETLNLSQLDGYRTGGTIHIIINNQIGFTTTSEFSRSSVYATDIAKMIQTPIVHVNGNDPEAVRSAAQFASEYRAKFHSDVIIDMLCYRKYGHNESDEPTYTQPLLYKKIKQMPTASKVYELQLLKQGIFTNFEIEEIKKSIKKRLDDAYNNRKNIDGKSLINSQLIHKGNFFSKVKTSIPKETVIEIGKAIGNTPENFKINPKLTSLLKKRVEMVESDKPMIDWGMGEALAFGSILIDNKHIRFTGQDSGRGTFSQRHAVLTDIETENEYVALNHIRAIQSNIKIFDSPLSEMAVLGFEYGYSVISDNSLTLWEAQFGDFANGAQPIFDQFIAAAEAKWGQVSNLVVLLPHSYDGQGPEHSSARMERYLQSCAEKNMFVCNFSTPAQYFHALRRQTLLPFNIPMIVMTPKSLLRHPLAVSSVEDFSESDFQTIIDDNVQNPKDIKKILLCSGKVYYDLLAEKQKKNAEHIAIVRVEQIYPLDKDKLRNIVSNYPNAKELLWVQEEPKNMGAWYFMFPRLVDMFYSNLKITYCGRKESASTATGFLKVHLEEQEKIVTTAIS